MTDESAADRARSGVRAWVRSAGTRLRRASPYGILAFLSAAAIAPIAGAVLGVAGEYNALLGQLGGMGGNYLADALTSAATRMNHDHDEDAWREAIATELLARLEGGDVALRDDLTGLLESVGAVEEALRAGDEATQQRIATAFDELQVLAAETRAALDDIRRGLADQVEEQRRDTGRVLGALAATTGLIRSLRAADPPARPPVPPAEGVSPYPGLASFDVGDAPFFHGRDALVATLLSRLDEHLLGGPPLVVVGVSGAGKSSLLRAGLLPAVAADGLGRGSGSWPWLILTPGRTPLADLRVALRAPVPTGRRIVLVDQFEELFTQCADPAERAEYVTELAAAPRTLLIIAVRADFYPQCTELPAMAGLLGPGQVVAGPFASDDLRRAITEPARDAGLTVEPGLAELLLRDYRPGALPLLAHALRATWERREGDTLTVAGYRGTGGIRRAVAETAERVYADLGDDGRDALRAQLLGLVTVVDGRAVRRRADRADVDLRVLTPLIAERLVTAGQDTVEVSHEALLDGWPRLAGWLADAREEILLRQRLGQAAGEWAAAGEDPDALYRGARLAAAREWADGRTDLPETQRRFLTASAAEAESRLRAERRTTRRLRRLVAGLGVALLLAVGGGLIALDQSGKARQNGRDSLSRQLAAESRTDHYNNPLRSIDRALTAWQTSPTVEARNSLVYAEQTQPPARLGTRTGGRGVAVSPDGATVAVGYADGSIELWSTVTLQPVRAALKHPADRLFSLRFSPDGRYLATGGITKDGVAVWNAATGELVRRLPALGAVAWLPDSSAVVAVRSDSDALAIGQWDPATGRRTSSIPLAAGGGLSTAVSPDGRYLAVTGAQGGILLRLPGGGVVTRLDQAFTVAFGSDGTLYTTSSTAGDTVSARRADQDWRPVPLDDPVGKVEPPPPGRRLSVSPDGTVSVASGRVGEVLQLTVGGPRIELGTLRGLPADLATDAAGRVLAMVGEQDPLTLFRFGGAILAHPQKVNQIAFDPSGARLATGSADPVIRIWDPRGGRLRSTLPVDADDGPLGLAFGPDGSLAAAFNQGDRVLLYDARERLRHTFAFLPDLYPGQVAFSPDGSLLAATVNPRDLHGSDLDRSDVEKRDDVDVVVWDTRTFAERARLKLPGAVSMAPAFTPDGRYLLVTANRSVGANGPNQVGSVWRFAAPSLTLVDSREITAGPVDEIAISPDSATVAVTPDQTAHLLRVDGLTPLRQAGRHTADLARVAWSPDGRLLATATDTSDGLILLWDAATGAALGELRGNSNQSGPLRFSPDSRLVVAGLNDWEAAVWRLDPAEAIAQLCADARAASTVAPPSC